MPIIFDSTIYRYLDKDLSIWTRILDNIKIKHERHNIYCYDIWYDRNNTDAFKYYDKFVLSKENSLQVRNEYFENFKESDFSFYQISNYDIEFNFLRKQNLSIFVNSFNQGLKLIEKHKYFQAKEVLQVAKMLNPDDITTHRVLKKLNLRIKEFSKDI
jgi:hypothetical protein